MFFLPARFRRRSTAGASPATFVRPFAIACLLAGVACNPTSDNAQSSAVRAPVTRQPDVLAPSDTDDFGARLPVDGSFSQRVVSLNPAATEVIFAIGAQAQLVGRSNWDEFPAEALTIPAVGDGIRPNVESILRAKPTLVILYASAENRAAQEALTRAGIRTITLRVDHIAQFEALTSTLGVALNATPRARTVIDSVHHTLEIVRAIAARAAPRTIAWPLWQQPVMVVGRGSYLDELIAIAGGRNVFGDLSQPSPVVSVEEIARRNPDAIVASTRTAAELKSKPQWQAIRAIREQRFVIDDPSLTGRPSIVLGMAAASLARAMHPELVLALDSALAHSASLPSPVRPRGQSVPR